MDAKGIPSFRDYLGKNPLNVDDQPSTKPVLPVVPLQTPVISQPQPQPVSTPRPAPVLQPVPPMVVESPVHVVKPSAEIPPPYSIGGGLYNNDGTYRMEVPTDAINPLTGESIATEQSSPVHELTTIPPPSPPPHVSRPKPMSRSSLVPSGYVPAPEQPPTYAPAPGPIVYPFPVPQHPVQPSIPHYPAHQPIPHSAIVRPGGVIPTYVPEQNHVPQEFMPLTAAPKMVLPSGPMLDGRLPPSTINGPMVTATGQIVTTEEISPYTVPPIRLDQPVVPSPQGLIQQPSVPPLPVQSQPPPPVQPVPEFVTPILTPSLPPAVTEQIRALTGVVDVANAGNIVVVTVKYKEKTPPFNTLGKKIREIATVAGLKSTLVSE